jgi:hypothetical protein
LLRPETTFRVLLVTGSVVFFWGLIELPALLNIVSYGGLETTGVFHNPRFIRITEPDGIHHEPPHAHYAGEARGGLEASAFRIPESDKTLYRWDLKYDRNGFRNPHDLAQADIVMVGDSMVEAMTVPDSQVTTALLGVLQRRTVANLGQFGYGPQEELLVLRRYGLPLRPRTVIWMFFESNDLADATRFREEQAHPRTFWNFFLERSFTRLAFRTVASLLAPDRPLGITHEGVVHLPGGAVRNVYFFYPAAPLSHEELSALDETLRSVASANTISAAQGARLLFVFIPDKFRVFRDFCEFPAASECSRWALSDLPGRMQKGVRAISGEIGYLDLTADLVGVMKRGELPYYPDDIHWSATGDRVAAEAINRYLAAWGSQ